MSNCLNCDQDCFGGEVVDKCLVYTGPDCERFGVVSGESYSKAFVSLLKELEKYVDEDISLSCLYDNTCGSCEAIVKVPEAVQKLVDKICSLSSKDISYQGERYCIGDTSISKGALNMLGQSINYTVKPVANGSLLSYDLSGVVNNLPQGYTVSRTSVVVSGKEKGGKTIISDSSENVTGFTVGNDRFPIYVDADLRVNTPSGDVKLLSSMSVGSPVSGTYASNLSVKDFGSNSVEHTLESFLEGLAAQTCANKQKLETSLTVDLPGCLDIPPGSNMATILSAQNAAICSLLGCIEDLKNIDYTVSSEGCEPKTVSGTPAEAIKSLSDTNINLSAEIQELRTQLSNIETTQSAIVQTTKSNGCFDGVVSSTGVVTTTGNCPGGNCNEK